MCVVSILVITHHQSIPPPPIAGTHEGSNEGSNESSNESSYQSTDQSTDQSSWGSASALEIASLIGLTLETTPRLSRGAHLLIWFGDCTVVFDCIRFYKMIRLIHVIYDKYVEN
jgi:hypothetical protein